MRHDAPAILIPLLLPLTPTSRPLARCASRTPNEFGLAVFVVSLLAAISIGVDGAAAQTLLTSDCPDGQSVCQVDSRSSKNAAPDADPAESTSATKAEPSEAGDTMPLMLTNADLGSTREALLEREAAERAVRLQRERERARVIERQQTSVSGAAREGGANALIPGRGASGGGETDEVWVSVPRDGERVAVGATEASDAPDGSGAEAARGSEAAPSSEDAKRGLADCMERSIRAGNGFVESRRVCEVLFPSR